jgi:drug/metabolite transporter (DMT)-like permease
MSPQASERYLPRLLDGLAKRHGGTLIGAILMVVACITHASMMAAVKGLADTFPVWQILLIRSGGQLLMLVPLIVGTRGQVLSSNRIGVQLTRSVLSFIALISAFYAIAHLPLASASAISFLRIIFIIALAGVLFSDRIGIVGWSAAVLGLGGIVIMLDPSAEGLNEAALIAAFGAMLTASVTLTVKSLTQTDTTATMMCYSALGLTMLCAIPSAFTWVPMGREHLPLIAILIASASVTQWCFTNAYRHGETSTIATVEYFRLVAAAIIGFLFFAEVPSFGALCGIALIIVASFIAVKRERIRSSLGL